MKKTLFLSLCVLFIFSSSFSVNGAGTRIWNFSDIETWLEGEFEGTGLTSRGEIIPTVSMESTELPARLVWDSVSNGESSWVATALPASIYRVDVNGDTHLEFEQNQLGVTALINNNGSILAGVSPAGEIYKRNSNTKEFQKMAVLSDSYIWSFQQDPNGNGIFISTGPRGFLYHMSGGGGVEKIDSVPGNNLMDLVVHRGTLYGGDDAGGLYRLQTHDGGSREMVSVYGFPQGEISSLASDNRYLYMGINIRQTSQSQERSSQKSSQLAEQLRQESMQAQSQIPRVPSPYNDSDTSTWNFSQLDPDFRFDSPSAAPESNSRPMSRQTIIEAIRSNAEQGTSRLFSGLSGTLVYRLDPPKKMNIVYNDPKEIVHDLRAHQGTVFIATGGNGRLYRVEEDFTRTAYFQTEQKNLLSVQLEDGTPKSITTGEGAAFYQKTTDAPVPSYRSAPIDAQLLSRWGTAKAITDDPVQFRTRSGNSDKPAAQWHDWSTPLQSTPFSIESPPARFLQFEAQFPGGQGSLENLQIAYKIPNQQPQIGTLLISPNTNRFPITEPNLSDSPKKKSSRSTSNHSRNSSSTPSTEKHSLRQIQWNVIDPDGDQLETSLHYQHQESKQWVELSKMQVRNENRLNWDTSNHSDGWYTLRLTASDRSENPPGKSYTVHKEIGPVLIDNTSPEIKNLTNQSGTIQFQAVDQASWIIRAEIRINGDQWRPLSPEDGIFDQKKEQFKVDSGQLWMEGDPVEVRIMDEGGNQTIRELTSP